MKSSKHLMFKAWEIIQRENLKSRQRENTLMVENFVSLLSTIGLSRVLGMMFFSLSFLKGFFYTSLCLRDIARGIFFRKIPFQTVFVANNFILFPSLDWSGIWICCSSRCSLNSKKVKIRNKHYEQKLFFLDSRFVIFRSFQLNLILL